jgi:hypothetical protein
LLERDDVGRELIVGGGDSKRRSIGRLESRAGEAEDERMMTMMAVDERWQRLMEGSEGCVGHIGLPWLCCPRERGAR